jgi:hypothetical protein
VEGDVAAPSANRINARAAKDRAFLKRALKNPGLRAKLDPKYLSKPQQASRALNTRLNAPITPGSSTTERDLAHAAGAATDVRYGPQERQLGEQIGISQTRERDTGSFYDEYQRQLAAHAANVQAFQAGAQQALAQTSAGITGLSGAEGAAMQQQANAGAAQQGVAPAGNLMPDANAAAAVRQALIGSFQGQQAMQGATANTYADTQANVVAPTQKLAARAQAVGKTTDLRAEEGAFNEQFRDTRRQDEFKNVLAASTLNANVANQQADNAIAASKAVTDAASKTPEAAAAKTSATASATQAAKYGYTAHQWAMLGPTARAKIIGQAKKSSSSGSDTVYTSGPFAGRKKSEIAGLSDSQRQQIVTDYNAGKGPGGRKVEQSTQYRRDFRRKYGIDPLTTEAHNTLKNNVSAAQRALKLIGTKDKNGNTITTQAIVDALTTGGVKGVPKIGALAARVALEVARGGITPATANRLHHSGYSVAALGYKMGRPKPTYKPPRANTPAGKIPGVGGN